MQRYLPLLLGLIIALALIGSQSLFVVNQTEKALIPWMRSSDPACM